MQRSMRSRVEVLSAQIRAATEKRDFLAAAVSKSNAKFKTVAEQYKKIKSTFY
jgi:hypothetical protein